MKDFTILRDGLLELHNVITGREDTIEDIKSRLSQKIEKELEELEKTNELF
jgi:hypothetical protein